MKTTNSHRNPELEDVIYKRHIEFKKEFGKNAILIGPRNLPKLVGDNLMSYIGGIVASYKGLSTYSHQTLQPKSQEPRARIANEWANERDKIYDEDIKKRKHQNGIDEHNLGDYHPTMMSLRLLFSIIIVFIYGLGEVMFNTKGFQV